MKKLFLSAAMIAATLSFAQKKEIAAAYKAVDAGDLATANAQIATADNALNGKIYLLDPETQEQYYYAKGMSLLKSGKTSEGAVYLAKINDLGKNKIYSGKDASKNKVYYVGKTAADASGISGLKEESYTTTTAGRLGNAINPLIQAANKSAVDAYNAKNYEVAGDKFQEVYNLLKAAGQENGQLLYNAGLSYSAGQKYDKASAVLGSLISAGYTGMETQYTAKNKKTGKVEEMDKNTYDLYQKMGAASDYSDFKTSMTKSIEQELYESDAAILMAANKNDEALSVIEKGLKKFPNSARLTELQGNAYYKSGKTDQFINTLKAKVAQNPNDFESYYNLGVLASKDPSKSADAMDYFNKALSAKSGYVPALQNLTFLSMGDDEKAVADIEAARKAGKTDLFNKLIAERRARFAKALPYAEKWYAADPNNIDAVHTLRGLYSSQQNTAKAAELKAKEAALQAAQK